MKLLNNKFFYSTFPLVLAIIFFWQFLFKGLLPIPSDAIIGLYHPYRDSYAKDFPRGITFKNFLITDPVRQQLPWKSLSIDILKKGQLPLWNPYSFAGYPLLANFQSAGLYPLNILFLVFPFNFAWSLFIVLEILLGGVFMLLYLRNLNVNKLSSIFGSVVFSLSGFSIAWLEWGNVLHTALWLPLILLSIDKINKSENTKRWAVILTFSLIFSFLAGHLQTFFYLLILFTFYSIFRWIQSGKNMRNILLPIISTVIFLAITSIQWISTLAFINESARNIDLADWQNLGWFIPWQHLLQFVVPDFFGNPATLNYWGVFNYAEFVGYVGIAPLLFALYALFFRKEKTSFFYGSVLFISLIFALPTIFAKLPFILNFPFISTAQPTRLIFLIDFSLSVLSALGLDLFLKEKKKVKYPLMFVATVYLAIWTVVLFLPSLFQLRENLAVARNNLILPSLIFFLLTVSIMAHYFKLALKFEKFLIIFIVLLTIFDLLRFGWKFTPFTKSEYLFPGTKTLDFLTKQKGQFRIMSTDSRILPPNFSNTYKLQSVEGYDPLYLRRYAELIAASERGGANIYPPFGFKRIITPHRADSEIIDLLGVKYVLSLSDLEGTKLAKIFSEGETRVYENKNAFARAFFVKKTILAKDKQESINLLFEKRRELNEIAIVENFKNSAWSIGSVEIISYSENKVEINSKNKENGFMVLTDTFYPTWRVKIDGKESKIYRADYNFRGVVVPKGNHKVEFFINLF